MARPKPADLLTRDVPDDPPPFLGTWRRVYIATVIYLAALIFGFYLFTRVYQ